MRPINAKDKATQEGHGTVLDRIQALAKKYNHAVKFDKLGGSVVCARIDYGRWIADCECGGAEYVDPQEPIFICMNCGNKAISGRARTVVFPENIKEIEENTMNEPAGGWQSWKRGE